MLLKFELTYLVTHRYYHLAKQQGYRARSAFKLIQLNRKFGFLNSCRALIDLCAAPGGWYIIYFTAHVMLQGYKLPAKTCQSLLLLLVWIWCQSSQLENALLWLKISQHKNVGLKLKKQSRPGKQTCMFISSSVFKWYDSVLHDGSPNLGGAWTKDAFTQAELVLAALRLATEFLAPNGCYGSPLFAFTLFKAVLCQRCFVPKTTTPLFTFLVNFLERYFCILTFLSILR